MLSRCYIMLSRCCVMLSRCCVMLSRCYVIMSWCYIMLSRCYEMLSRSHLMLSECCVMLWQKYVPKPARAVGIGSRVSHCSVEGSSLCTPFNSNSVPESVMLCDAAIMLRGAVLCCVVLCDAVPMLSYAARAR
jgi:hypothetical protein